MRKLLWVGASKRDLMGMPVTVQSIFGYALHLAQTGEKYAGAKPLKGFGSASVLEIVHSASNSTYRGIYTVRFGNCVYVLHCFQKKSTHGIATSKTDLSMIHERLKAAEMHAKENYVD